MGLHYATLVERTRITASTLGLWEFVAPFSGRLVRVSFSSSIAVGANGAEFDVRRGGTSLFASGHPTIVEGERSVTGEVSFSVAAGDVFDVDLSAVGIDGIGDAIYAVLTFDDEQADVTTSAVRAIVAEMLQAGENVTLDYDETAGTLTINSQGGASDGGSDVPPGNAVTQGGETVTQDGETVTEG